MFNFYSESTYAYGWRSPNAQPGLHQSNLFEDVGLEAPTDFNLKYLLCFPFRAAERGNFEAAVKLGIAYLYNEGCKCGSLYSGVWGR